MSAMNFQRKREAGDGQIENEIIRNEETVGQRSHVILTELF